MSPNNNFRYNHDLVRYTPERTDWLYRIKSNLGLLTVAIIVTSCFNILINALRISPEQTKLRAENNELAYNYHQLNKQLVFLTEQLEELEVLDDKIYRSILNQAPLDSSIRIAGTGGSAPASARIAYSELINSTADKLTILESRIKVEETSLNKLLKLAGKNKDRMLHLPAIMPVRDHDVRRIGSGFGLRFHPILNIYRMHEGLDFVVPTGTQIHATANGKIKATRHSQTFGNIVEIDHGYGYISLYAHLSEFKVKVGQRVARGDVIALSGNTGLSSGAHLHYEVHLHNNEVDPVHYLFNDLSAKEYEQIIRLAQEHKTSLD